MNALNDLQREKKQKLPLRQIQILPSVDPDILYSSISGNRHPGDWPFRLPRADVD